MGVCAESTEDGSWTTSMYCGQCSNESECSTAVATEDIVKVLIYALVYCVATSYCEGQLLNIYTKTFPEM